MAEERNPQIVEQEYDAAQIQVGAPLELVVDILNQALIHFSTVLFSHMHPASVAAVNLDAWLELEDGGSEGCQRAAPSARFHEFECVKQKAGVRTWPKLLDPLLDFLCGESILRQLGGFHHQQAETGREVLRINGDNMPCLARCLYGILVRA